MNSTITRARLLLTTLALALCGAEAQASPPAPGGPGQPNVLFLIADDLTATSLGCYGNPLVQTPNLDTLAARGMVFDRAYCQYPVCANSRSSMLGGAYPPAGLISGLQRMPEYFKSNGYTTMRVSKIYHMRVPGDITSGSNGSDHPASWTTRVNVTAPEWQTTGSSALYTTGSVNTSQPTTHYNLGFGSAFYVVESNTSGAEQADSIAVDQAITLMDQAHAAGNPFFLAVGFVRPHVPLVAPSSYFTPYDPATIPLAASVPGDLGDIPSAGIFWNESLKGPTTDSDRRRVLQAYYASVAFMDAQVGRLLTRLSELGLENDTIVVFTSDHGYHLGEHTFWQKLSLHEESAKVPLIMAGPGVQAGRTPAFAELVDLYPTLADKAGLVVPDKCQGLSLQQVLDGTSPAVRSAAFSMISGGHLLRTDRWAYMRYTAGTEELYDMHADPLQFTNLASDSAYAAFKFTLSSQLDARLAEMTTNMGTSFCAGDGSGILCPCGNNSSTGSGHGCRNATGAGAYVTAQGTPSLSADTLSLSVHQAMPNEFGIFAQNVSTQAGLPFYSGILCLSVDSHLVRHLNYGAFIFPLVTDESGFVRNTYPVSSADALGDIAPGVTLHYQFWSRDGATPCAPMANLSSGRSVTWLP